MRLLSSVALLIVSVLLIAGAPRRIVHAAPPPPPVNAPRHRFALAHQYGPQQAPSKQEIQSQLAQATDPGPGSPYVEQLPDYPPAFVYGELQQQGYSRTHATSITLRRPQTLTIRSLAHQPGIHPNSIITGGSNVTGINHYWEYEEDSIGGVGRYMVNVATGNLIVQADDMAISHKGIELAFRRTYNSFSTHDYANTDGSVVDNYGDGWTNTFDAHIAFNDLSGGQGISVFDIDGARYDYTAVCNPNCVWTPPPGQFASLTYDSSSSRYYWTKKSGTVYLFESPSNSTTGIAGRLTRIWGRNNNNKLTFTYYFDSGQTQDSTHLNKIVVQTEVTNTQSLSATLKFKNNSTNNASNNRLLDTLTWPDGTIVNYHYDTSGRLIEVDEPSNNSLGAQIPQWYLWQSGGGHLLSTVNGGRWANSNGTDGGFVGFGYPSNSDAVLVVDYYGYVNPTIPDGISSGVIQSGYSSTYGAVIGSPYRQVGFWNPATEPQPLATVAPAPTCSSSGTTIWVDTDGHERAYCWDSSNRVVQTEAYGSSQSSHWLGSTQTWDANNDLTASVDPQGFETDAVYDASGNVVAIAKPAPSPGGKRPTSYYSFDGQNNIVAYCDPVSSKNAGMDWSTPPPSSDGLCSSANGFSKFTQYGYASPAPSYEPYGELTTITTPLGYLSTFSYNTTGQDGADYGLPTKVSGTSFTESDGTQASPEQDFVYDTNGNLICYSADNASHWTILTYDGSERTLEVGDPDDATLTNAACPKTPGIPGSSIVTSYSYYADGDRKTSQSPSELAAGVTSQYAYDPDGNETSEVHHFGTSSPAPGVTPTTFKWYDGADRMVEVGVPQDPSDYFTFPWLTRYFYDLTQNNTQGSLSMLNGSGTFSAHGAMFKKQEYLPNLNAQAPWADTAGWAYDALDRNVTTYSYPPYTNSPVTSTMTYDIGTFGLLTSSTNTVGDTESFIYDQIGRVTNVDYTVSSGSTDTPNQTIAYDPDGRVLSKSSVAFGTQTYSYDAMGHLKSTTEPQGGPGTSDFPGSGALTSPATLSYDYYPNGWKEDLNVSSSALTQTSLFQYNFRADGKLKSQQFNYSSEHDTFGVSYTSAGRTTQLTDPTQSFIRDRSFDAYGRLASDAVSPTRTYNTYSYDPEGELTGFNPVVGTSPPTTFTHKFNDRSEMIDHIQSANGFEYPTPQPTDCPGSTNPCTTTVNFDSRSGAYLGYVSVRPTSTPCVTGGVYKVVQSVGWDAAGRQTGRGTMPYTQYCPPSPLPLPGFGGPNTYQYDAQNHQTENNIESKDAVSGSLYWRYERYAWGPNGHPIADAVTGFLQPSPAPTSYPARTLHWDGGQLLFTTTSNGQLEDLKIGGVADYLLVGTGHAGLTVWDRDSAGRVIQAHNSTGYSDWVEPVVQPTAWSTPGSGSTIIDSNTGGYVGPGLFPLPDQTSDNSIINNGFVSGWQTSGQIFQPTGDNNTDGIDGFQGVRSTGGSGWLTPDPLGGVVNDPMSQKPYVYDGNNAIAYADPTGFIREYGGGGTGEIGDEAGALLSGVVAVNLHVGQAWPNTWAFAAVFFANDLMETYNDNQGAKQLIDSTSTTFLEGMMAALSAYFSGADPHVDLALSKSLLRVWNNVGNSLRITGDWHSAKIAENVGSTNDGNINILWNKHNDQAEFTVHNVNGVISQPYPADRIGPPYLKYGHDWDLEQWMRGLQEIYRE